MKIYFSSLLVFLSGFISLEIIYAQDMRAITMAEYNMAKSFEINNLDTETYVKYEVDSDTYILDRYEMRNPIFITGDDGKRKRIDVYKLIARNGLYDLGIIFYYTTEEGKLYTAIVPNYLADGLVWEKYFEDIHSIDDQEKNFVLKLSYVLSREFSFQYMKSTNVELVDVENATYGSDICFPGDQIISLENGDKKLVDNIEIGDRIAVLNPVTNSMSISPVTKLTEHESKYYAITSITLIKVYKSDYSNKTEISLQTKNIRVTPNHPMETESGNKRADEIRRGDTLFSWNKSTFSIDKYEVYDIVELSQEKQPVYSIETNSNSSILLNDIAVRQK